MRNSNDFLEVFNYSSEERERERKEWNEENLCTSWKRCQMLPGQFEMVESLSDCVIARR